MDSNITNNKIQNLQYIFHIMLQLSKHTEIFTSISSELLFSMISITLNILRKTNIIQVLVNNILLNVISLILSITNNTQNSELCSQFISFLNKHDNLQYFINTIFSATDKIILNSAKLLHNVMCSNKYYIGYRLFELEIVEIISTRCDIY